MKTTELFQNGSTLFLKAAVLTIGTIVLALCLVALPLAWRDIPAEYPDHTYVFYAILIAMWTAALPFFYALSQALKILRSIDRGTVFSMLSVRALRVIAWCSVMVSIVYAASMPFFYIWVDIDDAPGLLVVAMILVLAPLTIAICAAVLQRLLSEVITIKSENDLTV